MNLLTRAQHSLFLSFLLHLLPGILILLVYVLLTPLIISWGGFPQMAMVLAFLLIGVLGNLYFMYYLGKSLNGSRKLKGVVLYTNKMPVWQLISLVIGFTLYAVPVSSLMSPVSNALQQGLSDFVPAWFLRPYSYGSYDVAATAVLITLVLWLLVDGILHPVVEELYFRGFLLPRLSRFGWWAPVINAAFFALFHLWQPQNIPAIFVAVLPWFFLVYWKRDVRLSIVIHIFGNSLGAIFALVEYLG